MKNQSNKSGCNAAKGLTQMARQSPYKCNGLYMPLQEIGHGIITTTKASGLIIAMLRYLSLVLQFQGVTFAIFPEDYYGFKFTPC